MENHYISISTKMRKILVIAIFTMVSFYGYSQTQTIDSLKEVIEKHDGKLNALDERVLVHEADLFKLNKIKISGYIQSQWEYYGKDLEYTNGYSNTFFIRRARVKFTYEALDGVKFVLQPDFSTGNFALKDAYAVLNIPKLKDWAIWAGQMNRINYEVEYSSGQREVLERSRVIRAIYPGEREIGIKLEYIGSKIPLKFQLMAMNGNFTSAQAKDVDSRKDLMGRVVYSVKLPGAGIGIDFGVNGYLGGNKPKTPLSTVFYNPYNYYASTSGGLDSIAGGNYLNKTWVGGEIQVFADLLGGTALKAEYISGVNSTLNSGAVMINPSDTPANKLKNASGSEKKFAGFYIYLLKNIGPKNQFVAKYDFYDPNTKMKGDAAAKSDLNYKTLTLSWQYYLNDFIRISLNYEMPRNETNTANPSDIKDNTLGIRLQAKF
jgi:hypothetical protein